MNNKTYFAKENSQILLKVYYAATRAHYQF